MFKADPKQRMNMTKLQDHAWAKGTMPSTDAAYAEMNKRYQSLHDGKTVAEVSDGFMKELIGK
jgi:hypothetical protein